MCDVLTVVRLPLLMPLSPPTPHRNRNWFVFAFLPPYLNLIRRSENFNAQDAVLAMKTDEGEYTVATSYTPPQPCIVFEYVSIHWWPLISLMRTPRQPKSIKKIIDPLKRAVLQHCP